MAGSPKIVVALAGRNDLFERHFLLAVEKFHAAANLNYIIAFESCRQRLKVVPHFRRNRAGAIAKSSCSQELPVRAEVRISFSRTRKWEATAWPSDKIRN